MSKREKKGLESSHPDYSNNKTLCNNKLHSVCSIETGQIRDNTFLDGDTDVSLPKKKMHKSEKLHEIMGFTPPRLTTGKCWVITFYAFDPALGKLRRKRIKINEIKKIAERRIYAQQLIKRLNDQLMRGWNPWIEQATQNAYTYFEQACSDYRRYVDKLFASDSIREETYTGYISYLNNLVKFNDGYRQPIKYIYQFNIDFCNAFLDHVWLERGNSGQTRDNYLNWLRIFSLFLLEKRYINENPTSAIRSLGKKKGKKQRTIIDPDSLKRIRLLLEEKNKHYLLACYVLFYCFVRPKEMSHIRLSDISIANGTLFIPAETSKNGKDGVVTLPNEIIELMVELSVFNNPSNYFLFSDGMMPGAKRRDEKQFRDFWLHHVRKPLKLPSEYKFYSLKDTGITELIRANTDLLTVRDQARHHSLLMTDIYTPHDIQVANEELRRHKGSF